MATAESVSLWCWRCDRESVGLLRKSVEPKFEINVKRGRAVFRGCAGTAASSTPLPLTPQLMTRRSSVVLITLGRPHLGSTFSSLSVMRGDGHSTDTRGFPFNGRQELWRWIRKLLCEILLRPGNLVKTAQDDTRFSEATGLSKMWLIFTRTLRQNKPMV